MNKVQAWASHSAKLKAENRALMGTIRAQALLLSDVADVLEQIVPHIKVIMEAQNEQTTIPGGPLGQA